MTFSAQDRLFVLTGAGISAESGLATFRGSGGLWNGHRVEDVATPEAWQADPALVWRFYSMRRRDALAAQPNAGHLALAALERQMPNRFYLCTQNVDDLHERAGSHHIHHMHGQLFQSRCTRCNFPFPDQALYETTLPTCQTCGHPIRPHIVWFGEIPLAMAPRARSTPPPASSTSPTSAASVQSTQAPNPLSTPKPSTKSS